MLELVQIDTIKGEIESFRGDLNEVLDYTKKLNITSIYDAKTAINCVAKARKLQEEIEEKKKELSLEAKNYLSKVNSLAKEFLEPLSLVEDMIEQKLDHWKMEYREKLDIERLAWKEFEALGLEVVPILPDNTEIESDLARAHEQISHTFELQDENLIPRDYLTVDGKKINLALKNGIRAIPGITIIEQRKTVIRRK